MIPMSLGIATSTRIGNSLGANLPFTSRNVAVSGYVLGFLFAGFNCVVLLSIKDVWGRVYSSDETVVKLVSQVIPLAALFQLNDGLGAVGSGVLRGWFVFPTFYSLHLLQIAVDKNWELI